MLKRYWLVLYPENIYGPGNIGVTAFSIEDAKKLVKIKLKDLSYNDRVNTITDKTEIIENIDIRLLDKGHVVPNMGVITFRGIWFPNLNLRD